MIPQPTICNWNAECKTVSLWFHQDVRGWNGEYYMRGGICWPREVRTERGMDVQGYALVAGLDMTKQTLTVFAETDFKTIDHFIPSGANIIETQGLSAWLDEMRAKFCCDGFYCREEPEHHRIHVMQVHASAMIQPKPHFMEVHAEDELMQARLVSWLSSGRLAYNAERGLHQALQRYEASSQMGQVVVLPAVSAMQAVCVGLDRHPPRKRIV